MAPSAGFAPRRVFTLAPLPPEQCAYALARYSRSPDSIVESLAWVREHDSQKFLESFYFDYGHASIADLGHLVLCFEGISELAATEIEDEQLWDGQARSSRYQNFSRSGVVTPPDFDPDQAALYRNTAGRLIDGYLEVHCGALAHLKSKLPRPDGMNPAAYERNLAARAFDVARYLLPLGVPTGVGQVTSIRTLEKQVRRMAASPFAEIRELAAEVTRACAEPPVCGSGGPLAPTLARHLEADAYAQSMRSDLAVWLAGRGAERPGEAGTVDVVKCGDTAADIAAALIYPLSNRSYRSLVTEFLRSGVAGEIIDTALRTRTPRDELPRAFRNSEFAFDIVCDIGAYRDLHRHRRCQQFRQEYGAGLGYDTPEMVEEAGLLSLYRAAMEQALEAFARLPQAGAQYILPLGTRGRFLFKMDFAEAEYIARLRSGVKGHFSYRRIAWLMKEAMDREFPQLGRLMHATHPSVEDPLKR